MKYHLLFFFVFFIIVSTSCAGSTPKPTKTPVSLPAIPDPIGTPALIPIVEPVIPIASEPHSTEPADEILIELNKLLGGTEIQYQNGKLIWTQDKRLDIRLSGPSSLFAPFAEGVTVRNFILKSDVTWEATGILMCGMIFRSEAYFREGRQYQFVFLRLSGTPAWVIRFHELGYFKNSPTQIQYSSAIDLRNGATNQFVLIVQEGEFNVYINGVYQGRYFDYSEQQKEGAFAFFANQDSGEGHCDYDDSWVWALE